MTVKVILSADPERNLNIPIEWTNLDGATNADRVINISSVDFVSGEMENDALVFSATQDSIDDDGESVELRLGTLPAGVTHENPTFTTVNITDDDTAARHGLGDGADGDGAGADRGHLHGGPRQPADG